MLTILFIALMIYVLIKFIGLAIKMAWGITKVLLTVFFLPTFLIALVAVGLIYLALPILAVMGLAVLLADAG